MALSAEFIEQHIEAHRRRLALTHRDYRAQWPSRLFHHAPVENAASILRSGTLLSRNDSHGCRVRDIAGQDVIGLNDRAHSSARLYFRPRTPTQYRIEGVRKPAEYYNGQATAHAPVLIMLIFDARTVLQHPGVQFSDCNMQIATAQFGDDESFFGTINFEKVYHEGGTGGDQTITACRCAEVLAPSPLPLDGNLQWIYCRSVAERQMLLHFLGDQTEKWRPLIKISEDIRVFHKDYVYVEEVNLQSDGATVRLHPRADGAEISVEVRVVDAAGVQVAHYGPGMLTAIPPTPGTTKWWIQGQVHPGVYQVEVKLENCLAFRARLVLDPEPF